MTSFIPETRLGYTGMQVIGYPMDENLAHLGDNPEPHSGIPDCGSPVIEQLLNHWLEIRGGKAMPARRDLDPTAMPQCLPHLWLYRYHPEEDEFVCELAGDSVNTAWNRTIAGCRMRTLFDPERYRVLHARWRYVLEKPVIMQTRFPTAVKVEDVSYKPAERLTLPLADREGRPRCLLGITIYNYRKYLDDHKQVTLPDRRPLYFDGVLTREPAIPRPLAEARSSIPDGRNPIKDPPGGM